jgi:hypothetical protein
VCIDVDTDIAPFNPKLYRTSIHCVKRSTNLVHQLEIAYGALQCAASGEQPMVH